MRFSDWMALREEKDACYRKVKRRFNVFPSAYASGALVQCRKKGAENWGNSKKTKSESSSNEVSEGKFDLEKERGLRGWFDRNNGKGWIDCRASTKDKKVPCGRKRAGRGADRKYPACRPTLSACNKKGVRRKRGRDNVRWE